MLVHAKEQKPRPCSATACSLLWRHLWKKNLLKLPGDTWIRDSLELRECVAFHPGVGDGLDESVIVYAIILLERDIHFDWLRQSG
jgi:hypothetical protein